mmetsp:Transcript_22133/g.69920  ORF Transcript_22133/g.69920 Transcript_22133/m.69920 type:complete len:106 (+) Transcript_22133:263-580(+)
MRGRQEVSMTALGPGFARHATGNYDRRRRSKNSSERSSNGSSRGSSSSSSSRPPGEIRSELSSSATLHWQRCLQPVWIASMAAPAARTPAASPPAALGLLAASLL